VAEIPGARKEVSFYTKNATRASGKKRAQERATRMFFIKGGFWGRGRVYGENSCKTEPCRSPVSGEKKKLVSGG